MAQPEVTRRLAAIFAVDMVGYSRLMEVDEEDTIARQKAHRAELIDPTIAEYRGRIVKLMGDGALVEFASVVDAVKCAVAVQQGMAERETDVPEDRRIRYRIGVNSGDIVIDGDDILGDGVNVAARLEGLAEPGGICIPRKVFEEVRNKLDVGYAFTGEQKVKNIETAIPVYRVLLEPDAAGQVIGEGRPSRPRWQLGAVAALVVAVIAVGGLAWWQPWVTRVEPASLERMAFPLPDKPSIAVLAFANLSGDATQDYLGDGISENITTALSRVPDMFVIDRGSTRTYKGKPVKVQQVAEELGVRYVLKGSVQRSGDQVRVTAQLIDALTGRHLWAERYDLEVKNTFTLQDEITLNVLTALAVKLTEGEGARALRGNTNNPEAYQLVDRGLSLFRRMTKEDHAEARGLFQKAVKLDPNYAMGWYMIGFTHRMSAKFGWGEDRAQEQAQAVELTHKALAIDPSGYAPYTLLADMSLERRQYDEAIGYGEKAVALAPNTAYAVAHMGRTLVYAGRPEEGLPLIQRGIRLSPYTPEVILRFEGYAYHSMGRYEEAIAAFERARARDPKSPNPLALLALTYADMDQMDEARAAAQEVLKVNPSFSAKGFVNFALGGHKDRAIPQRALATLRQLGLTKNPPLKLPDKPSIAVLAFDNLSGDAEQDYFGDGIAENIITALSKIPHMFVIARNSSFTYKGKPVKVQQVAEELGVRYVLEGSVQRSGDRVRIAAQLIDAVSGHHLWAERYDRQLADIFALQDDIAQNVVTALEVKLTEGEQARVWRRQTNNPEAYEYFLRGRAHLAHLDKANISEARRFYEKAVALDPNFAVAWGILSVTHQIDAFFGYSDDRVQSLSRATDAVQKAVAIDDTQSGAHYQLANLAIVKRQYDQAIPHCEKALSLEPTADVMAHCGRIWTYVGRPQEALELITEAMRRNPYFPGVYFFALGNSHRLLGNYDEAVAGLEAYRDAVPKTVGPLVILAATYVEAGRMQEARATGKELLERDPGYSIERAAKLLRFKDPAEIESILANLRKAGVPEE